MNISMTMWIVTIVAIFALIALDFVTVSRTPHEVKMKEAALWSIFYVGLAVVFGVGLWFLFDHQASTEFFAAYLVEKSLSVDNLFVFIIILAQFATPPELHQRVLLVGVAIALVLRGVFIAVGAAALASFAFTFVIFGAILIWTGIQLARHRNEDPEPSDNAVVRIVRRKVPFTGEYHGNKMFTRIDGRRVATPLLLVMIAIGSTDVLFALDSIPATFGVTQEPYLVFTANAFALLGLRALYFVLKGALDRLVYLSIGLAVILVFIGIKLVLTYLHTLNPAFPHVPIVVSLGFIVTVLVIVTVASLLKTRKDPTLKAHAGRIGGDHHKDTAGE